MGVQNKSVGTSREGRGHRGGPGRLSNGDMRALMQWPGPAGRVHICVIVPAVYVRAHLSVCIEACFRER